MAISPSQKDLEGGERDIVRSAVKGIRSARVAAAQSGQSLMYARDGLVYEKRADGSLVEIERVEAPRKVVKGWKAKLL